ncbi:MAG: response regulator transcription factor [Polyangiales bacterium]
MAQRILLIEDDAALGAQIVSHLERAGYVTEWLKDGRDLESHAPDTFDLVVLDLMLPSVFGLDLLKTLRERSDVPVMILSARNESAMRVRGLQLGADDYVTKPFWPEELVERVRARLRRPVLQRSATIEIGALKIDLHARTVVVGDEDIVLTATELAILGALAKRRGTPVTRQALVDLLEGDSDNAARTLDVHVSRLRKKLGEAGAYVETVWGIGYKLGGPSR